MILTTSDLKTWPGSLDHLSYDILKTSVDVFKITTITSAVEAVKRLAKMSKPFDLESIEGLNVKLIKDYVEDFLVQRFFKVINLDVSDKTRKWQPTHLVGLYNDIIEHLASVLMSKELEQISWPIPELKKLVLDEDIPSYWNDFPYLEEAKKWIINLKLPYMKPMKTMHDLDQYLSLVGRGNSKFSIAYSKICSSLMDNHDDLEQVPWPDVVQALIDY